MDELEARLAAHDDKSEIEEVIKKVLPAVVPELRYDALDGVQDGGMAMEAFLEAIHPDTPAERKNQIEQQLLAYCKLDTYAMVRLWQVFAGRTDLKL